VTVQPPEISSVLFEPAVIHEVFFYSDTQPFHLTNLLGRKLVGAVGAMARI